VSKKPYATKFGLNHVVGLIENKKAQLVLIANDVDPIELVVFLPALCRKMGVPYAIVKGKARLGTVVHQKVCSAYMLYDMAFTNPTRPLPFLLCPRFVPRTRASSPSSFPPSTTVTSRSTRTRSATGAVVLWVLRRTLAWRSGGRLSRALSRSKWRMMAWSDGGIGVSACSGLCIVQYHGV
jgi:ribosomal protein L7Ae-like RNA K-turn-binding protein